MVWIFSEVIMCKDDIKYVDVYNTFLDDTPYGKDPDKDSKLCQTYHKLVWSRQLPNGEYMDLECGKNGSYLVWKNFDFGSDSIIASFRWDNNQELINEVKSKVPNYEQWMKDYSRKDYTIGGVMIFPKRPMGINPARGMNQYIKDRFDLTLECIRRYYNNEDSPLYNVLLKDKEFFDLFVNFKGFVDYFFLNDLVTNDYQHIKFLIGNGEFVKNPIPKTFDEYMAWMNRQQEFLEARNKRIKEYIESI